MEYIITLNPLLIEDSCNDKYGYRKGRGTVTVALNPLLIEDSCNVKNFMIAILKELNRLEEEFKYLNSQSSFNRGFL